MSDSKERLPEEEWEWNENDGTKRLIRPESATSKGRKDFNIKTNTKQQEKYDMLKRKRSDSNLLQEDAEQDEDETAAKLRTSEPGNSDLEESPEKSNLNRDHETRNSADVKSPGLAELFYKFDKRVIH